MSGRGGGLSSLLLRLIFLVVGEEGGGRDSPYPSLYNVYVLNTLFYFQYLLYFHENYV